MKKYTIVLFGFLLCANAFSVPAISSFGMKHGAQGTGNYKGKRDRHEKPTPMHEKKRKNKTWIKK